MRKIVLALCAAASSCAAEQWEGEVSECTNGRTSHPVSLIMYPPGIPTPQGDFTQVAQGTAVTAPITEATANPLTMSFSAIFEARDESWRVSLNSEGPSTLRGTAAITSRSSEQRCTVVMQRL